MKPPYLKAVATSPDQFFEKGLPSNLDAERSILGAVLLNNSVFFQIPECGMKREDFFLDSHRRIFDKMEILANQGSSIDLVTLSELLRRACEFEQIGGATYVASLIDGVPRADNIRAYIKIVQSKALLRRMITLSNQIIARSFDEEDEPEEIVGQMIQGVHSLIDTTTQGRFENVGDIAQRRLEQIEAASGRGEMLTGIPTGFTDFDQMTAGFQNEDLIIIAARPGMGKSAIALNMALFAAKNNFNVGIFSLEMSAEQLVSRLLCSEARVDAHRLRTGYLNQEEWARLADALRRFREHDSIFINETASLSVEEIGSKARQLDIELRMQSKESDEIEKKLDMLIVDYMQLMSFKGNQNTPREQQVSHGSRQLKILAKQLRIPIIALSQLSRATETRKDHRPQLSDLRESGSIEQDSDLVVFLTREEEYTPTDENRGCAELIIGKQRNGPTGSVSLAWLKEFTRFENLWRTE